MKNYIKRVMILVIMTMAMISPMSAHASTAFRTFTISVDGEEIETQTAYEPVGVITDSQIQNPQDIFIDANGMMYVADSENNQIVVLNQNREVIKTVGNEHLENPTGVAVDEDGNIFVADANTIVTFSKDGEFLREFGRPDSPLFGARQPFKPLKVSLDVRGNMYIVGEGASNGIIQLNQDGEFLGYFGANSTTLSFFQAFRNFVFGLLDLAERPRPNLVRRGNADLDLVEGLRLRERIRERGHLVHG